MTPTREADFEIPVRGEAFWRTVERPFAAAEAAVGRVVPEAWNPLVQAGAIANVSLLAAIASGVLLLFWYVPSVHQAYPSVEAMMGAPLAALVRGVHRYSSDAMIVFGAWHGLRLLVARRFTGPRWIAWLTGLAILAATWLLGWLGYWLVWDEGARQIATGTARLFDPLPLFAEPLSRSFLVDGSLSTLLFFVVFFIHMLLPLAVAVLLWLHIGRVARSKFFPTRGAAAVIVALFTLVAIVLPAPFAEPARMAVAPDRFPIDLWFTGPVALTDRLPPTAVWALLLVPTPAILAFPWLLARRPAKTARVIASRCVECNHCASDCPYDAITMQPRTDGKAGKVATIDPNKCVGCGICAGSCDGMAIGLDHLLVTDQRKDVDAWLAANPGGAVAFVCAHTRERPPAGHGAFGVPCAGYVHALTVERALKHGASEVLVVGCPPGQCRWREGMAWAHERVEGAREPALRPEKVDGSRVRFLGATPPWSLPAPAWALGFGLLATGLVAAGSHAPYTAPAPASPELVVSFVHPGEVRDGCREPTAEEQASRPAHMRAAQICERGRAPVRLRVEVDRALAHEADYAPSGLWGDGASVAVARVPVPAGAHDVRVTISDRVDGAVTFEETRRARFADRSTTVVAFERHGGFAWTEPEGP